QLTDAATFSLLFSIIEFYTALCSVRDNVILDALYGDLSPTLHDLAWDLNQCYVYSILISMLISLAYTAMRLLNRDYRRFYLVAFTYAALQSIFYPLFLVYFAFVNCKINSAVFSGMGPLGAVATTIWQLAWKLLFFWWLDRRFKQKFRPASRRPNEARLINEQLIRECGIKGLMAGEALAITLLDVD
ncbi:hypothetical protein AAVH_27111, partial [Aphelenchoides avenae]